jgi:ribosomal protein S24E
MKNKCDNVITLKQYGPTCWFNSILMAVLYSEESRKLLLKKSKTWNNKILIFKTLKHILEKKFLRSNNIYNDYEYFDKIRPEYILEKLYKYNKKKFTFNPKINKGYASALYIRKIYKLLGVKVLYLDLKGDLLYYSKYNNFKVNSINKIEKKLNMIFKYVTKDKVLEKFENPNIIIINCTKRFINNIPDYYKVPTDSPFYKIAKLDDNVNIKGMNYVQDSVLLGNWNRAELGGHSIAGIKCKGDKYVYNGWTRGTIDIHLQNINFTKDDYINERIWVSQVIDKKIFYINVKNDKVVDKLPADGILVSDNIHVPCELMKYDWNVNKDGNFCINKKQCFLDTHTNTSIKKIIENDKNELCFSFNKGPRNIIYVNTNSINDAKTEKDKKICPEGKVLNPLTNRCINIKSINKLPKVSLSKIDKKCPEGKVLNPKTGRCIKIENLIKVKDAIDAKVAKVVKECPEGKVLNPKTGRCIKKKIAIDTKVAKIAKECPEGKVLNPNTGRCIKKKIAIDTKVAKIAKECPEGKVLNPKTGRCIKIKI